MPFQVSEEFGWEQALLGGDEVHDDLPKFGESLSARAAMQSHVASLPFTVNMKFAQQRRRILNQPPNDWVRARDDQLKTVLQRKLESPTLVLDHLNGPLGLTM